MSLTIKDLEEGLKKYEQAIENAENDREFAQIVIAALKKEIEEKSIKDTGDGLNGK